ncbi:MAG: ORF6N domain-containing protein [Prevotellaceae bacterium]|jgi:hypothetical protein|nr:ORF6N domain-containing protein [Prevotellaceae bacterium]
MELSIIQSKIYEVRGRKVMLDVDLAELYGAETAQLKRAVKRNIERFEGDDFMFEVTNEEYSSLKINMRCQIGISNEKSSRGGTRYAPLAFTELGVAMLSSVLNSAQAIKINRDIMRAFVVLRQYALGYAELNSKLEDFMVETNMQFNEIYQALIELAEQKKMQESKPRRKIGFALPHENKAEN